MAVVVVLAAVVLAAVGCWVAQQTYGLGITGMNNSNSWGLYIMAFMFFVGLSAGGLIVASSAHVFGIESFKRVSVPAVITSSTSRTSKSAGAPVRALSTARRSVAAAL